MDEVLSSYQAQAEFTALLKASRAVLGHREFPDSAKAIFETCQEITGARVGFIALLDQETNTLSLIDTGDQSCRVDPSLQMQVRGVFSELLRTGKTIYENDITNCEWRQYLPEGHEGLQNVLFAPLMIEGSGVGFLGMGNKAGGFNDNDARLTSAIAEIAAIALVNSRYEQSLQDAYRQLGTQVEERTSQLNQVVQELEAELDERKKIENRLRLQTAALESSISGILITDPQGNIQWSNPAFTRMTGYTSQDALDMNIRQLGASQQEPPSSEEMWATILQGKMWQGELVRRRKDGFTCQIEQTITPVLAEDGSVLRLIWIMKDITQQRSAQQELQESEKLLRSVIETMPVGVVILDKTGQIMIVNQEVHRIWSGARYIGMDEYSEYKAWFVETSQRLEPGDWAAVHALQKGEPCLNQELEIEAFDGSRKFILNSAVPYLNDRGDVIGAIVTNQDITALKNSEKMLEAEKAKLKNILDSMTDGIYIVGDNHQIEYANPVILKEFGQPDQLKCYEYFHNRSEVCPWCVNERVISGETINREMTLSRTGKVYDLYDTPLKSADGSIFKLKQLHDITRRKLTETQLEETNQYLITLSQSERNQRQLAETLSATSQALSQTLDLSTVTNTLLDHLQDLVTYRKGWIFLLEEGDQLVLQAAHGIEPAPGNLKADLPLSRVPLFQQVMDRKESMTYPPDILLPGLETGQVVGEPSNWLVVPITAAGSAMGVCVLELLESAHYSSSQVHTVEAMVSQAAVAIQNARLYQAELRARQMADILRQASLSISKSLELDAVLNQVLDSLNELIQFDAAFVALSDSESNFSVHTTRGGLDISPCYEDTLRYLSQDLRTQDQLIKAEGILIHDTHSYFKIQSCPSPKCMRSWILMPLKVGEQVFGFYLLQKAEPHSFSLEHFHLVEAMVSQAAIAGQNAWLFEQVRYGHERLMDLSRRMVQIQENERSYIARELHDESGQALASLLLGLDLLERSAHQPEKVIEGVARLEDIASGIMENLHRIAMNLRPASLDHLGLINALQQYVQAFSSTHSIEVQFDSNLFEERLPAEIEVALYRIAQEALTNVVRHAKATHVDLKLEEAGGKLNLIISDNGVGFDPKAKVSRDRLGLIGMRERAGMLGGEMLVESTAGSGTTVKVEIPWTNPDNPSMERSQEQAA